MKKEIKKKDFFFWLCAANHRKTTRMTIKVTGVKERLCSTLS